MPNAFDIGLAGEQATVNRLKQKDFKITTWNTSSPGSTDIEAQSSSKRLLVQVKSAILPNDSISLSSDEERNIKSRAARIGAEAWETKVWLDNSLNLIDMKWRKLN